MTDPADDTPSITCPRCNMTSYNPNDIEHGYCGNCHDYTSRATAGTALDVPRRDDNRRAVVTVTRDLLAHAFGLPHGIRVVGIAVDDRRDAVLLKVEGDEIPASDPHAYPPEFGEATVHQLYGHEGHDWYRIEWSRLP